jgi:D-serine deaminase-like pyridoxal phosphate-dependent protein
MLDDERLHRHLIGQAGSRRLLNTPALVLDRDLLDRNIAAMATYAREKGRALRPHAKTHKSREIANRQLAAGAVGICCAKLGEAEALASGLDSILITSPIVSTVGIARYVELNARVRELTVVVDHPENVAALAGALGPDTTSVLIDVDPGIRRTGVASPDAAVQLLAAIQKHPNLKYRGLQFYCGLEQHIATFADRRTAIAERTRYLESVITLLTRCGGEPRVISGGGTGTHRIDAELGVMTEWQAGSYVFMDSQYAACELDESDPPYARALFVDARIISANTRGVATTDAGFKALSSDGGAPLIAAGAPDGATFVFMGDEHSAVIDPALKYAWQIGDSLRYVVPHCDPTVNLYDAYHVVQGDTLVEIWPVTARGRSR